MSTNQLDNFDLCLDNFVICNDGTQETILDQIASEDLSPEQICSVREIVNDSLRGLNLSDYEKFVLVSTILEDDPLTIDQIDNLLDCNIDRVQLLSKMEKCINTNSCLC